METPRGLALNGRPIHDRGAVDDEDDIEELEDESETEDDADESLDRFEVMGDLAELLGDLSSTWWRGSEDEVLVYLWSALRAEGLVKQGTYREHVRAVAALLALHRLKTIFYTYAFDEGDSEGYESPAGALIGDFPKAQPFWIGVAAGNETGIDGDLGCEPASSWEAEELLDLATGQYGRVVSTLVQTLGENELFAALWSSSRADAAYPVPGPVANEILNEDPWEKEAAWSWLINGAGE